MSSPARQSTTISPRSRHSVGVVAGGVHHGDDLFHRWWVSRISLALVARRSTVMKAG